MAKMAKGQSIRVAIDDTNESVGKKIRKAELLKVPYSIVVGDQEIKEGKVKPRARSDLSGTVSESLGFEDFLKELKKTL